MDKYEYDGHVGNAILHLWDEVQGGVKDEQNCEAGRGTRSFICETNTVKETNDFQRLVC